MNRAGLLTAPRPAPRAPFAFEELDETTRHWTLQEFRAEQDQPNPFRSNRLTEAGLNAWIPLMEIAIKEGNEQTLAESLRHPEYWLMFEQTKRGPRSVPWDAYYSVAITEFNTWYVRGLCRRLIEEGVLNCQVYRAAPAREPRAECGHLEDQPVLVQQVYEGHRARYWPEPGNPDVLSIPIGINCHHTIRRLPQD